jgi:hypothetical protein
MFTTNFKQPKKEKYCTFCNRGIARIKPGKKTNEWNSAKAKLKVAFAEAGITYDEVCLYLLSHPKYREAAQSFRPGYFLTWAHGDKRRNLVGNELYTLVALAGIDSHNFIEKLPSSEMREIIEAVIVRRPRQPIIKGVNG